MSENRNDAGTEYASVEDPLSMHRTASNETTLSSEIPNVILEENVIIAPGQEKFSASILSDEFCGQEAFSYLFPRGRLGYNTPGDVPISPAQYFNQRPLNFQYFASDADYIFFARSLFERHQLRSSINFTMDKNKPSTITAGMVKK